MTASPRLRSANTAPIPPADEVPVDTGAAMGGGGGGGGGGPPAAGAEVAEYWSTEIP